MTQNIPKRSFLGLSAIRWTCGWLWLVIFFFFFAHGARVGRQKKYFRSGAETKLFYIDFDGSVGKPETRLFFYAIESPCHVVGPH